MARKGQVSIQDSIETNDDFVNYLEQHVNQLICMEVCSDYCGPCLATGAAIRKGKLEIGQDRIAMGRALSDNIDALERFKGKSEPVFLFIVNGLLTRAMFGANGIELCRIIEEELNMMQREIDTGIVRPKQQISDMLPEEAAKLEEDLKIEEEYLEQEERLRVLTLAARKRRVNSRMSQKLKRLNFILFWPHCHKAHYDLYEKWDNLGLSVGAKEIIQLTEESAKEALYMSDVDPNEACLHALLKGEALLVLFKAMDSDTRDLVNNITNIALIPNNSTKMSVEGVMVSYNYSEDEEQANILTVSASGIKFSNRWVLTHGSILSPLKQAQIIQNAKGKPILNEDFYNNLPEIYVTCEKTVKKDGSLYESVEQLSRERSVNSDADFEHSSYQIRVLTGRICHVWQCPILDRCVDDILYSWTIGHRDGDVQAQTQLGKALLSVFVLVDLESEDRALKTLRPLSELLDIVRPPPQRGSTIEVHSTPFGCEAFLNAVTRGSICGVVGRRPSLLLADVATALGSEGGPVFTEGPTNELIGTIVCSVSWWRGEWVGLTLAAPLVSVLTAKLRVTPQKVARTLPSHPHSEILERIDSTTLLVRCGAAWGAGAWLGAGAVLTAAHVVKNHTIHKVSLFCGGVKETAIVRYKTTDDKAFDLALLYTNPEQWKHLTPAVFADDPAEKGESVLAAGYPYFSERNLADLKPTVTTGHINSASPSMLQTSCCVQSGFSGGPIFRLSKNSVSVLGIIVSNAKTHTGACYPYINMAVPVRAFKSLLENFAIDKDTTNLKAMENNKEIIQSQWRLMPYRSKI